MKPPKFAKVKVTVAFVTINQTLVKVTHLADAPTIRSCQEAVVQALEKAVEKYLAGREKNKIAARQNGLKSAAARAVKANGHG